MRTRFISSWGVLALALSVPATYAAVAHHKGINSALLAKANAGDAEAQYQLGSAYNYGDKVRRDYAQALFWYRKGAEQGNAKSEFQLGGLYHFGHGVPQDDAQGFAWIMKAAEQQYAVAENFISVCYAEGWGVPQDNAHQYFWLRRAAEDGDADSQYFLGWAYEDGLHGVYQDYTKAYFWLDIAASESNSHRGRREAVKRRNKAASHLTAAEQARVEEQVREWIERHAANSQ